MLSFYYVCTETDRAIIESVKKIPSSPRKEELVLIDDVPVSGNHMECLFQPHEYLSDEITYASHNTQSNFGDFNVLFSLMVQCIQIIDAYVKLLKA